MPLFLEDLGESVGESLHQLALLRKGGFFPPQFSVRPATDEMQPKVTANARAEATKGLGAHGSGWRKGRERDHVFGSRRVSDSLEPTMTPHPHPREQTASARLHHRVLVFLGSLSSMD